MSDPWGQPQQQSGDWAMPQDGVRPQAQQQATFAPPPNTDSGQFGAPAPQAQTQFQQPGVPQQYAYGEPQQGYGVPQQPYGQQAPYGYPAQPQKQGNGFAVAGFILSLTVVFGLIFSIIGLARSSKVGGKGRVLSIVGIILSIAAGVGYVVLIVSVAKSATALDPGCTTAESRFSSLDTQINSDTSNPNAMMNDLTSMQQALQDSANQAVHNSVKVKLQAASTDLQATITDLKALQGGSVTDPAKLNTDLQQFETDGTAIDTLCSSF